jgi:hypothetical protein
MPFRASWSFIQMLILTPRRQPRQMKRLLRLTVTFAPPQA